MHTIAVHSTLLSSVQKLGAATKRKLPEIPGKHNCIPSALLVLAADECPQVAVAIEQKYSGRTGPHTYGSVALDLEGALTLSSFPDNFASSDGAYLVHSDNHCVAMRVEGGSAKIMDSGLSGGVATLPCAWMVDLVLAHGAVLFRVTMGDAGGSSIAPYGLLSAGAKKFADKSDEIDFVETDLLLCVFCGSSLCSVRPVGKASLSHIITPSGPVSVNHRKKRCANKQCGLYYGATYV